MFTRIAHFATERWGVVLALTALFCVFGWQRFRALPIEAFPDVTNPMVEVIGVYPGQAAEEVERRITLELERVLAGTPGLTDLRSVSVFGLALLTVTFDEGTRDFELRRLVAERLVDAELPEGAEVTLGPQATPVGQIYRYTLEGPRSLRELRALQDFVVERRLRAVPGVADVVTFGGFERQYQVRIDPSRLAALDVSIGEVYDAVANANANAGGGYVGVGSQELIVRGVGAIVDPAELGLAVIRAQDGVPIRVRDVADVVESSTPRRGAVGRGGANEVVEGIVLLRRGEHPTVVLEALHERIEQINTDILPPDVRIDGFYDRTNLVDATLHTVGVNLTEGALLVLAVVYLFLRTLRAVLIVAVVIPVSMLSAFVGLHALGMPANLISLGAIDFGILVDGAIIVVESTLHAIERDGAAERRFATIRAAVVEVAKPVGLAMSIIIVALAPIFALQRVEGRIFAPMAYTYAFALLGALACAAIVVPALEVALLRGRLHVPEPRWIALCGRGYAALLGVLRPIRWLVLGVFVALAAAIGSYASRIGTEFLPELNEGGFYITAVFPSTISVDETRRRADEIRGLVLETPEVQDVLSHVGRPEGAAQAEGPNNAEFFVVLAPQRQWRTESTREGLEDELRLRLERIPGVQYNFSQPITDRVFETISGIIGQVVVKIRGQDYVAMQRAAEQIREALHDVDGIADLALYQAGEVPSLRIDIDRDALARRGVSVADVQRTIRIALGGEVATEVWEGEKRFAVALRLPERVRADADAISRIVVGDPRQRITLGELAHIEVARGRAAIWREDFTRFLAVKFNVRGRDLGTTVTQAQAAVAELELPEGVYVTWGGEFQNQRRALSRLAIVVPIALLGIVGVLHMVFRRALPTGLVMSLLPFAVIGAVGGLRLLGENFSVSSAVGCIALLGQVVLSGVVLCTRIDAARAEGAADPLLAGARAALRPVLLTTTLALLGLLPAAMSHAMGSETQRPFAIAIVAGLLVSLPATLVLLPLLYAGKRPRPRGVAVIAAALVLGVGSQAHAAGVPVPAPALASTDVVVDEPTFTLDEALALSSREHPRVQEAKAVQRSMAGEAKAAGLWTNPTVALDYFYGATSSSYDRIGSGVLGVGQFIERGVPRLRRDAARHREAAASAHREGVAREIGFEVESAFVELVAEHRAIAVFTTLGTALREAERIVEHRISAGTAARYDARRVTAARIDADVALARARTRAELLRGELDVAVGPAATRLVGVPALELEAGVSLPALRQLMDRGDARRVAVATALERSAAAEIEVAKRGVFPGVGLRLAVGFGQAPGQFDVGFGVAVPLPTFNRGQGTIDAARARYGAASHFTSALRLATQQRLGAAHRAASRSAATAAAYRVDTEGVDDGLVAEAQARYREGRLTVLELVDAFDSATSIRLQRIDLSRTAWLDNVTVRRLATVGDG